MEIEKENKKKFVVVFLALFFIIDCFAWGAVFFAGSGAEPKVYFLDVGQGDSELVVFPGNIKILTDAGPDSKIVGRLDGIPELADRYIDIAVISHPQLDHFNGFRGIIGRYRIGAFVYNGRSDTPGVAEWPDLLDAIRKNGIPVVRLGAGDKIIHPNGKIDFLSPSKELVQSAELNDTGFVEMIESNGLKILLTADIDAATEKYLAEHFDIRADLLKVAHHGSKFSSSAEFLEAVRPKAAIIGVGGRNRYGHPTAEALRRLADVPTAVFRTDKNGQITAILEEGKLKIFAEK